MSQLRQSLLATFINNYCGLAINIVSTIALARLLTPTETGLYSISAGIINIVQVLREFGTGAFIIQEKDLTNDKLASAVSVSTGLGGILTIIFLVSSSFIGATFKEPRLTTIIQVLSVNFIIVSFASIGMSRLQREMRFDQLMWIGMAQNFTHAAVSILLASLGYGALGMAWASVISIFILLVGCAITLRGRFFIRPGLKAWRAALSFGAYSCGGYLLQAVGSRMPDIVVGRLLGFDLAGIYSRGNGLITLFEQAVISAINPVATSALAQVRRSGADLSAAYLTYIRYVTVIAWPCLGMMSLLSLPIIFYAFGRQWLPAVPVAQIMCLAAGFVVLTTTAIALMNASGAVRRFFALQAASLPFQLGALIIGGSFSVEGVAWGMAAWSAFVAAISVRQAQKTAGIGFRPILVPMGDSLLALAATVILPLLIVRWLPLTVGSLALPSLLAVLGGLAGWLVYIFASRHPIRHELLAVVGRRRVHP